MSDHLDPELVAGLAMLEPSDPERKLAEAHARECAECRGALDDAARVLASLDVLSPPPSPPAAVLARVKEETIAKMAEPSRGAAAVVALLAMASFGIVLASGRSPGTISWGLALAVLGVVGGGTFLALSRGTTRDSWVALTSWIALAAALAVTQKVHGLPGHGNYGCGVMELVGAVLPVASVMFFVRTSKLAPSAVSLAATAAAGALAGQMALSAVCGNHHAVHVVVFHFGSVVAAGVLGALLGSLPIARPVSRV